MLEKMKSRKFLIVVVTFFVGAATELFGVDLDPNVVYGFIATALAYIGVEGLADNSSRKLDGSFAVKMLQAQLQDLEAQARYGAEQAASEIGDIAAEIGQDAVPGAFPPYEIGDDARARSDI